MNLSKRRVVVTGVGVVTPIGETLPELQSSLSSGRSGVVIMPEWQDAKYGLGTRLAAPVSYFNEAQLDRKVRRTLSRVGALSIVATGKAIEDSGLPEHLLKSEKTSVVYGSSMGGTSAIEQCFEKSQQNGVLTEGVTSTTFLKIMPHTCASNIAIHFQIPGRIITACVACASGTQAVGLAYESIKNGYADQCICGGAEELTPTVCAIFDVLGATSVKWNAEPSLTPKPFDVDRDGIVVAEGAVTFVLEEYQQAKSRGAKIYAEIVGFHTNNDAIHMTNPSVDGLTRCMSGALQDAGLKITDIDYVNAHAAGTHNGDLCEALAISSLFGTSAPVSSLKGHLGHMMGAAGAAEIAACLTVFNTQEIYPTLNLHTPDPQGGSADFVLHESRKVKVDTILKNSFAFGGVNASLVLRR